MKQLYSNHYTGTAIIHNNFRYLITFPARNVAQRLGDVDAFHYVHRYGYDAEYNLHHFHDVPKPIQIGEPGLEKQSLKKKLHKTRIPMERNSCQIKLDYAQNFTDLLNGSV